MNVPIRKVASFVALLMAALLVNITWISVARTDTLNEDGRNRRVRDAEFSKNRGSILVGNTPIAQSVAGSGRFPYLRSYPQPELWSSVTGWYSYDYARSGLEQSYNQQLAGTSSSQAASRVVDILSGRQGRGANLSTTLNPAAQAAAVSALGNQRGAVVAMDYTTGEVLALVSTPTYDPNRLATVDLPAEQAAWTELLNAPEEPLKNRATREVYPPGSTFKLVTAAAALEDGMVPSTEVDAPASLRLPNSSRSMGNSTNCGGDRVTLEQALKTSCNTAFGNIGLELGADKMIEMAEKFGFNKEQTIDISAATSRFPTEIDEAQTALTAIGQFDVAASPLQIVQVAAAIANNGEMMKPYLVSTVTNRDLTVLSSTSSESLGRPISEATAQHLRDMMVATVEDGTGRPAQIDGVVVGGKTGTAQTSPDRPPYAWFVGYAEDPKVAVVAFVEDADVERDDISGGRLAAPIFKAVVEALR
ncbi:penicillin-binding transpeptidase domain-containing protein [Tessaracoccus lubricantis]|uniref:Penicillin-binding transpeptidase domain-containing protein n=1 Tax=Tessaracoccus lubricantis TaxID=545543 RepID=A0ABP9FGX5_9ACTN